jgi:hypothetical protein
MEEKNLFAGIFIESSKVLAAVIDTNGKPILCSQYRYVLPKEDFLEIIDHLAHFADFHGACLRVAAADRWDAPLPLDPLSLQSDDIMRVTSRDLAQISLAKFSYAPETDYDKAKLLALLGALRYATNQKHADDSFFETQAA